MEFMYPFIEDKIKMDFTARCNVYGEWPIAQPALVFSAVNFNNIEYFNLWKNLEHNNGTRSGKKYSCKKSFDLALK